MLFEKSKTSKIISALLINFVIAFAIIFIYYTFNYKPSRSIIKNKIENEFKSDMVLKSYLIDNELSKFIEGARSISSRSMIRNKIIDYKNNKISCEELRNYTNQKYTDGIKALESCSYAARYVSGKLIVELGDTTGTCISKTLADTTSNNLTTFLNTSGSDFLVSIISPIVDDNTVLGHDIICFKSSNILNIIQDANEKFEIIEPNNKEGQEIIDFTGNKILYQGGLAYYLYKSKFADVTYRFSKPEELIFKELETFDKRQIFVVCLLTISLLLIISIIRQRVKLFYFKRSKYLEELVAEKTSELNSAIEELKSTNDSLQKSEAELKESNKTKDKFFSIIAHDLINPFHVLLGFVEVLKTNYDDFEKSKQKSFLSLIAKEIQNTYKLLENLLSWSRSQRGEIKYSPRKLELAKLTEEVLGVIGIQASHKSISLINNVSDDLKVYGDKDMMLVIIRNLISNSIKFTENGGTVEISATEKEIKDNRKYVQVSVKDNGVGIESERLPNLFSVSDDKSTIGTDKEKGTGLGLILCKEFIERHNGKIWAESKLNEGSAFIFTIPGVE